MHRTATGTPGARAKTPRVLIAGSGVAAVEAVLALRHIAGRGFEIELLAPVARARAPAGVRRGAVRARCAAAARPPRPRAPLCGDARGRASSRPSTRAAGPPASPRAAAAGTTTCWSPSARARPALPGALDVPRPGRRAGGRSGARRGRARPSPQLVVASRPAATWPLPAYELAIMARDRRRAASPDATVTCVTPEREPLWIFGEAAGRRCASCSPSAASRCAPGARRACDR